MDATVSAARNWKRLESETLVLNPEKAKEFAGKHHALPHSPTERDLEEDHVNRLALAIREGRAIAFNWATVQFAGATYRMNGQHSSLAILNSDGELPDGLVFHVDKYRAENKEAMANLFRQFDARWSSRSKADVSGAYQGLTEDLSACARWKAKLAIEGVAWYRRNIEKVPVPSGDDTYDLFFEAPLHKFVKWVDAILNIKTPEMKKAAIVGAMYATFCKSEERSEEFWQAVAKNNAASDSAPSAVLSTELVKAKEAKTGLAPGEFYAKCIKAWNAFREGESIRSLNVNTKKGMPDVAA